MLDPCSTSSYISEEAAEQLELHGQGLNLTIAGTGGVEVKTRSRRVELTVTNLDGTFLSLLQAHVLDNIAGGTPAIRCSELKDKWPHLRQVPFESVSRRRQIDIMIGSDHPVFHHVLKEACGDQPNDPIARLTNLGWVCFGPTLVEEFRHNTHSTSHARTAVATSTSHRHLMKFCEHFGNSNPWGSWTSLNNR